YVETYTKHGLGSPESPTISDEGETVLVAKGDISLACVEPLTIALIKDQNPDMMENQIAMWGPNYLPQGKGDNWQPGAISPFNTQLGKAPPQADAAKWERKIQGMVKLYNDYLMSRSFQEFNFPNDLGVAPTREDVFDPILDRMGEVYPKHMIVSEITQIKASDFAFAAHPTGNPGSQIAANVELALKEDHSPEEAMEKAYDQFSKVLADSVFG
ncbi:MAG: hypothetical protein R3324_10795, partial [Halobacteriales archaeon]|nr:hypothetical protein [Halobacteriales archaeon]